VKNDADQPVIAAVQGGKFTTSTDSDKPSPIAVRATRGAVALLLLIPTTAISAVVIVCTAVVRCVIWLLMLPGAVRHATALRRWHITAQHIYRSLTPIEQRTLREDLHSLTTHFLAKQAELMLDQMPSIARRKKKERAIMRLSDGVTICTMIIGMLDEDPMGRAWQRGYIPPMATELTADDATASPWFDRLALPPTLMEQITAALDCL